MFLTLLALVLLVLVTLIIVRGSAFVIKYSEAWAKQGKRPKVLPRPSKCPRCGQRLRRFERILGIRNLVVGGWTCPGCGSEFDLLDNVKTAHAWNASLRDAETRRKAEIRRERENDGRTPVQKLFDD